MQICPGCGEENPDKFRLCGFCGTALAPPLPPQEVRKTVTIVFSDLKGSTAMGEKLDSEAVREVMSRYFDEMRDALEAHGGTIEKYIGDAIMAVFGLPKLHEDDALRAVRAAAEMRDRLAALNAELDERWGVTVGNRTGVNTGEVVAGDPTTGQRLVTGDTVNTAARLEQAAPTNEVLLGEETYHLVRHAVEVEPVEPLELKGKAERVPAYRLVSVRAAESVERRHDRPIVGRDEELATLLDELRTAIEDTDSPEQALAKLEELAGPDSADVAARVASAVGLTESTYPIDEIFWATRKLLATEASRQPLVVYFDDIHWAELAFLELIEHVAANARDVPLLLLCAARPTLHEIRPTWKSRGTSIDLRPLTAEESARIIDHLLGDASIGDAVRARIVTAAEGNPLFVEQLLSMLIDEGSLRKDGDSWVATADLSELKIPGSIQALLSARLDLLSAVQRTVIEPASVVGLVFERAAIQELAPDPVKPEVEAHLIDMTQKQLLRPDPAADYRFQHILIRDAAYQGILKRARAGFHERFVDWAERINRERDREAEFDEILGYHLEQARTYLGELGPLDEHGIELGRRGAAHLAAAGRRAFARGDMGAASGLLRRAVQLLPEREPERIALLPDLGEAMMETGEFGWAQVYLDEAAEAAAMLGNEALRADAVLTGLLARHHVETDLAAWSARVEETTSAVIPVLEQLGAHAALAKAWRMVAFIHGPAHRFEAAAAAVQRSLEHARLAGDRRLEARMASAYAQSLCAGPTPVATAIAECEGVLARDLRNQQSEAIVLNSLACLVGLDGDFDRARALSRQARTILEDLGAPVLASWTSINLARVELLAGAPEAVEARLRQDYEQLESLHEVFFRSTVGALLAQALYAQGRLDDAEALAHEARRLGADGDIEVDSLCCSVLAKIGARRGAFVDAVRMAEEAVRLIPGNEAPLMRTDALVDLAEVYATAGDVVRAQRALDDARSAAEIKEMTAPLTRIAALRDGLSREPAQPIA